jgi:hypothetical protein
MKKKLLIFAFFAIGSFVGFAQTASKTPVSTELKNYAKQHGSYISDIPQEKSKDLTYDGEISLEKAKLVDPSKMGIAIADRNLIYKITNTNQMLIVKSVYVLENELKNSSK